MTTHLTENRRQPGPAAERTGIPFGRLLRTELRKLRDTRAGTWLLIGILAVTPVIVAVMVVTADPGDLTYEQFVNITQTPQKLLLPVVGILTVTTEWSQRTGLVTFTLEPDRKRVLLAKACATLLLGVLVLGITFSSAAVGNLLGAALRDGDGAWAFGAGAYLDIAVVLLSGLMMGFAFGMLLLTSAPAIIAFFVLPNLSSVLFNTVPAMESTGSWVDFNLALSELYDHGLTAGEWLRVLTADLVWVALPAAVGALRVLRSEVKSG
ncbi:ABC transporter permease [Streptomyces sp. WAC 06738]|uniref:ABC transporter permease n=1 Tax=Streptomyces sp. WAC 06738 TaxID=2203210 RepID=UPI000F70B364|nr:ABC transporter permease [Streptomyces sp. WAC 06738]AZM49860.1 ABC transporter permease [Streptomyces sp. WAC 06738]